MPVEFSDAFTSPQHARRWLRRRMFTRPWFVVLFGTGAMAGMLDGALSREAYRLGWNLLHAQFAAHWRAAPPFWTGLLMVLASEALVAMWALILLGAVVARMRIRLLAAPEYTEEIRQLPARSRFVSESLAICIVPLMVGYLAGECALVARTARGALGWSSNVNSGVGALYALTESRGCAIIGSHLEETRRVPSHVLTYLQLNFLTGFAAKAGYLSLQIAVLMRYISQSDQPTMPWRHIVFGAMVSGCLVAIWQGLRFIVDFSPVLGFIRSGLIELDSFLWMLLCLFMFLYISTEEAKRMKVRVL